jgi:hypothetical protein
MSDTLNQTFMKLQRAVTITEVMLSHGQADRFYQTLDLIDSLSKEIRSTGGSLMKRIDNGKETSERKSETPPQRDEVSEHKPRRKTKLEGR